MVFYNRILFCLQFQKYTAAFKMEIGKILRNSIWFGVIPKLPILINVILLPVITPYLTNTDYGVWGVVSSYSGIFLSIYTLGLHVNLINSYYEYGQNFNLYWSRILRILLLSSVFFSILASSLIFYSLSNFALLTKIGIASLSCFPILFNANFLLAQHLYTLRGTPRPLVIRNLISSFIGIIITFILIKYLRLGYIGFIVGAAGNSFLSFLLFIRPLWIKEKVVPIGSFSRKTLFNVLYLSFPAVPHALGFLLLSASSRIIMRWSDISIQEIGIYTNGYVLGDYITIVTTALAIALLPQIQSAYRSRNYLVYRYLYYLCQGIAIIAIMIFAIWMSDIYQLLIKNHELHQSIQISKISCFANAVYPLYIFMSTIVFIEKKTFKLLWLVFIPGVLNIILCSYFIPRYGYKVAVYIALISYWSQILIPFVIYFYKKSTIEWLGRLSKLIFLLLLLLLSLNLSLHIGNWTFYCKIFFTIILMLIACITFIQFKKHNKN